MKKILTASLLLLFFTLDCSCQNITQQEELMGSITPERAWWDLQHYDLNVEVFPETKSIKGSNTITYKVLDKEKVMQIDLQAPMKIDRVEQDGKKLKVKSKGSAHFIKLQNGQKVGDENQLTIYFSGKPVEAKRPPWDGGFTWSKDEKGKDFIATSNQGIGASIWWPNKDHPYDEPDLGVTIAVTAPKDLMDVSNGRLMKMVDNGKTKTWIWKVVNPINNYAVNINIGDYVHFGEKFEGLNGELDMDYYVLSYNLEKARVQFQQAPQMMRAFEYWFGPYPFYEDSFKLVEAPYLGMEHQSSVTYGNNYQNGYLGTDLSETGWGLQFDFIIIHESGHEWFANNITNKDIADMWIHEGFTAYSENLYLNYQFSDIAASEYVIGTRKLIRNDKPIIGTYNANRRGSDDMYYKGANILHTVRQMVNDDTKWRNILRGLNKDFYHQNVSSKEVEEYISEKSGLNLSVFWDQYLRTVEIPKLEYSVAGKTIKYRFTNSLNNLEIPVVMIVNGKKEAWITPTLEWQSTDIDTTIETIRLKEDFYLDAEEVE